MAGILQVKNTRSLDGDVIWKTLDKFYQTYWSGLDCRIYANNILIDEIISLQYTLQEAVMPLFAYHSYTYETVLHGARRVEGSFTINYKRDSYLYELLRQLDEPTSTRESATSLRDTEAFRMAREGNATLEVFTALAAGGQAHRPNSGGRIKVDPVLLKNVAEDFEQAMWGAKREHLNDPATRQVTTDLFNSTSAKAPRFELPRRFDINIQFGSAKDLKLRRRKIVGGVVEEDFDAENRVAIPVATSTRIIGVALNGNGRVVDDSGKPIIETYSFIAKDVL